MVPRPRLRRERSSFYSWSWASLSLRPFFGGLADLRRDFRPDRKTHLLAWLVWGFPWKPRPRTKPVGRRTWERGQRRRRQFPSPLCSVFWGQSLRGDAWPPARPRRSGHVGISAWGSQDGSYPGDLAPLPRLRPFLSGPETERRRKFVVRTKESFNSVYGCMYYE